MFKQDLDCLINDKMSFEQLSGLQKLASDFEWWRHTHHQRWIDDVIYKIESQGIENGDKEKIAEIIDWKLLLETLDISPSKFWEIYQESEFQEDDEIAESKDEFFSYLKDLGIDVDGLERK